MKNTGGWVRKEIRDVWKLLLKNYEELKINRKA